MTAASTGWPLGAGASAMASASTLVPGMMGSLETLMSPAVWLERVVMVVMEGMLTLGAVADVVGVVEEMVEDSLEEEMVEDFSEEETEEVMAEVVVVVDAVVEVVGVVVAVEADIFKSTSCEHYQEL